MSVTLVTSPSAEARLERARQWLADRPKSEELLIVGGSVDGALELGRMHAQQHGGSFGWQRVSIDRLAAELAAPALARAGRAPASRLALEAIWARVVHTLAAEGRLGRFAAVADRPGLPRALERMMHEARHEAVSHDALDSDLSVAAQAFEAALKAASLADRAEVLTLAAQAALTAPPRPVLLLDVAVHSHLEAELALALIARAPHALAAVPTGDARTLAALNLPAEHLPATGKGALSRLQTRLFVAGELPKAERSDELIVLSAPGEVRECVELARLIHKEAAAGTPFDRMAVVLRAPGAYRAAITEALRRAEIPAYFARGTRQPDPAGRALLALLACAEEGLSASGFAEYLSLGEVPQATASGAPPAAPATAERWAPPDSDDVEPSPEPEDDVERDIDAPVVAGTLRAPRRWEKLLLDAAVIGGRARWVRRLDGLNRELARQRAAPDITDANAGRLDRTLLDLAAFRAYALPLLDVLEPLAKKTADWSGWLAELSSLATRALRFPDRVLALLAELEPMGTVGPVDLREVKRVLSERLLELTTAPDHHRFGHLFVGPIDAVRGLAFDVVFVPGLAERIFPQKVREDPIAPDRKRALISPRLITVPDRISAERLALQLAVGAARRRVVLSYPRLDTHEGRPRVPSFYALEALRAAEGELPTYEQLSRRAEQAVEARVGWPAPRDADEAIDPCERDLALLDTLFHDRSGQRQTGRARYLIQVNPFLTRALRLRWARMASKWSSADGLVQPSPEAAAALEPHRLANRAFSATALQHLAACPYRFFLSAILRLSPREEPEAIEELDPLQRGSMVHNVQFEVLNALREAWPPKLEDALAEVDRRIDSVATQTREELHPAIARVWDDGIEAIRADVRQWMRKTLESGWTPLRFELSFGLGLRDRQDADSRKDPVELEGGLKLRGSIDLVEQTPTGSLWATDYKTGKRRSDASTVIGGGKTLQPILYSLALEKLFPEQKVEGGTLWYCTQAGDFEKIPIPLEGGRAAAVAAIETVGNAIERGFLPVAPGPDECTYCDYRSVCGTDEERRIRRKHPYELEALKKLREQK